MRFSTGEKIIKAARAVIKSNKGCEAEVVAHAHKAMVLRFAGSRFHQGAAHRDSDVFIRVICGKKVGVASCNSLEAPALALCFASALDIARHVKEEPFRLSLPGPSPYAGVASYFEATASSTPADESSLLSKGFKRAARRGVLQSGALITRSGVLAVANSNGVEACHPYTSAFLSVVSTKGAPSGISTAFSKDISRIGVIDVMDDSAEACIDACRPKDLKPGSYRVLLWPQAVSELLYWLSYIGFGAKNFHDGTSFLSGKTGRKITGENVTVFDDGLNPAGMSVPFDMEGSPKRRVPLIEGGVAKGAVYDAFSGASAGKGTTGNASFPEEPEGPLPSHIFMKQGSDDMPGLLAVLDKGIAVKSFHYVNGLLNPRHTLMTGMTRHGTFYVEGGRIKHALNPARFTENIMAAFGRIERASRQTMLFPNHDFPLSSISAPALLIDGFSFTG